MSICKQTLLYHWWRSYNWKYRLLCVLKQTHILFFLIATLYRCGKHIYIHLYRTFTHTAHQHTKPIWKTHWWQLHLPTAAQQTNNANNKLCLITYAWNYAVAWLLAESSTTLCVVFIASADCCTNVTGFINMDEANTLWTRNVYKLIYTAIIHATNTLAQRSNPWLAITYEHSYHFLAGGSWSFRHSNTYMVNNQGNHWSM